MFIPLIPKDPDRDDFTCRDGEIDFIMESGHSDRWVMESGHSDRCIMESGHSDRCAVGAVASTACCLYVGTDDSTNDSRTLTPKGALTAVRMTLIHNLRIPLQGGDRQKAELMLGGEISRVDPATVERLTQAIVEKAAECLLDLSTDLRRQGLFILPFRFYTLTQLPDGSLSYPSAQGIALPADYPPYPEITAATATDDCLTLALRFPVTPLRLTVSPSENLPTGYSLRTFISYPLYIPDPKEMRGSIGAVRSAAGGSATGIRFSFLSLSAMKASVAAPEKYYELVGNVRTGYRLSSKAATPPDYSCYAALYGYVPPFPRDSLLALGEGVDADTDPLDWIADWVAVASDGDGGSSVGDESATESVGEGYLPVTLPYKYWSIDSEDPSATGQPVWPEGIDGEAVMAESSRLGATRILLTRPMCFADDSVSRRHAQPKSIRTLRVVGLSPEATALAVLYGSDDGVSWTPLRRFDPRLCATVLTPPRLFWRLLLMEGGHSDRRAARLWRAVILTAERHGYGGRSF